MQQLTKEIIGSILLYLACTLSSAGGVGGGIMNVSIFLLLWGETYSTAVKLSLCTLLGNYFSQVMRQLFD
jgi:uncharacterized membrane protein YfcA